MSDCSDGNKWISRFLLGRYLVHRDRIVWRFYKAFARFYSVFDIGSYLELLSHTASRFFSFLTLADRNWIDFLLSLSRLLKQLIPSGKAWSISSCLAHWIQPVLFQGRLCRYIPHPCWLFLSWSSQQRDMFLVGWLLAHRNLILRRNSLRYFEGIRWWVDSMQAKDSTSWWHLSWLKQPIAQSFQELQCRDWLYCLYSSHAHNLREHFQDRDSSMAGFLQWNVTSIQRYLLDNIAILSLKCWRRSGSIDRIRHDN